MNIELSPETEKLVQQELERGAFGSASSLVDEAVQRLLQSHVTRDKVSNPLLRDSLIGVFDSTKEPHSEQHRDAFAELIADKLERQGLKIPWRR